jgi:hypothetical protein
MHISDWYFTLSTLAGVDPNDEWLDPTTNLTHNVDGVNIWPAISGLGATSTGGVSTREFLPTTAKSLLWDQSFATPPVSKIFKLIQGNETQAVRFHPNGSNYDDPFNACLKLPNGSTWKQFDCQNTQRPEGGRRSHELRGLHE